jgi:nucleoside-diphosphate-sugar epimerase
VLRGDEVCVHGDGTSLWTLTHATDFAVGLVGLIGAGPAIGEDFHITSEEALGWNEIYAAVGRAVGTPARLVHLPSEFLPILASDWFWVDGILGDLQYSAVFDNTKIRRYVPAFRPTITWAAGARRLHDWQRGHPEQTGPDAATDALLARLVDGHHRAAAALRALAPADR